MRKKVILGKTYKTRFGTEFTPVIFERGKIKRIKRAGNPNSAGQRGESRFIDAEGNRIRKSKLIL